MEQPVPPYYIEPTDGDFQSITSLDSHRTQSFEELRLADYVRGQGVFTRPSSTFGPPPGLVTASLPPSHFVHQTPRAARTILTAGTNPFSSRVITCRVGKEDKARDFTVHESIITTSSEFTRTALTKEWKEAKDGILPLPEDDIAAFELYQQWLYTGRLFLNRLSEPSSDGPQHFRLLVKSYLLGEKLVDYNFKDILIDCIIFELRTTSTFDPRLTNLVYEGTPPQSPLRCLWLDIYVRAGNPMWLNETSIGDFVKADFLLDLGKYQTGLHSGFSLGLSSVAAFMGDSCAYHEHVEGRCYRSRGD